MKSLIKQNPILSYLVATYAYSWAIWLAALLLFPESRQLPWIVTGAYGPTVVAIAITAISSGKTGLKNLLSKYLLWRANPAWYLVILLLFPLMLLVVILIYGSTQANAVGSLAPGRAYMWLLAPLMALPLGPLGEELGWRGFLLPRLQARTNALNSSLILGAVWTFWHTPLFWAAFGTLVSGYPVTFGSVAVYLVQVTALTILFTWIYNHTRGSVLLAILFHAVFNAGAAFKLFPGMPDELFRPVMHWFTVPLCLFAAAVLLVFGPKRLTRQPLVDGETMLTSEANR